MPPLNLQEPEYGDKKAAEEAARAIREASKAAGTEGIEATPEIEATPPSPEEPTPEEQQPEEQAQAGPETAPQGSRRRFNPHMLLPPQVMYARPGEYVPPIVQDANAGELWSVLANTPEASPLVKLIARELRGE